MQDEVRKNWKCPHPFCGFGPKPLTKAEIRLHYSEKHACGRCNAGKHHKCKGREAPHFCGCGTCYPKKLVSEVISDLQARSFKDLDKDERLKKLGIIKRTET